MSPTGRTLEELRQLGYLAQVVEKWNPWAKIRQDLYGFLDVLAIKAGEAGVLGIQTTTGDHASNRLQKAIDNKNLPVWLASGNRFEVWSWSKKGPAKSRKLWELKRQKIDELMR